MSPQCLSPSFGSIWLIIREQMWFEYLQDGSRGSLLIIGTEVLIAILNLYVILMPPIVPAQSNLRFEGRCLKIFKMATMVAILDIRMERFLAILNLHVSLMPPTKFHLNPTYHSGADVVWRFSRLPPWRSSWISEWKDFNKFESPCPC